MADQAITLREHLEELRKRLMITVVAVILATILSFVFYEEILGYLLEPAQGFGKLTHRQAHLHRRNRDAGRDHEGVDHGRRRLSRCHVVLYQLVMFVSPGLNRTERIHLYIFLPGTIVSFLAGALFGYYILFPAGHALPFYLWHRDRGPMIRIGNYMSVVTSLLFWMGIIFELPLVMFFMARLGVVTSKRLFRYWRLLHTGRLPAGSRHHAYRAPYQPDPRGGIHRCASMAWVSCWPRWGAHARQGSSRPRLIR